MGTVPLARRALHVILQSWQKIVAQMSVAVQTWTGVQNSPGGKFAERTLEQRWRRKTVPKAESSSGVKFKWCVDAGVRVYEH
jgi:hypothetical protein